MPNKRKKKLSIKTSFDELDESLLLGDDNATPTKSRRRSGPSIDILDDELLGESPIVIKKSKKRRKTRNSTDQTPEPSTEQTPESSTDQTPEPSTDQTPELGTDALAEEGVERTAEGTTAEGTTAEGTTAEGTPAEGTTEEGTTAEGTTAEGTTTDGTTAEGTTAEGTTAEGTTADGTTAEGTTVEIDTVQSSMRAYISYSIEDHMTQNNQSQHISQSNYLSEDISIDIRDVIPTVTVDDPPITAQYACHITSPPITAQYTCHMTDNQSNEDNKDKVNSSEETEIDIYSDLSTNHSPPLVSGDICPPISAPHNSPPIRVNKEKLSVQDITFDEIFKMSENQSQQSVKRAQRYPSEKEDEDLDYEDECEPQMKIGVLVTQTPDNKTPDTSRLLRTDKAQPQISTIPPMLIPPMLPLPPITVQNTGHMTSLRPITVQNTCHTIQPIRPDVLQFPPPHYQPMNVPSFPRNNNKRKIYINPKFKTQVILSNLEKDGVLKGGVATVHINSRHADKQRSRSPVCHGVPEYVPSPIRKSLDEPTTTLIVTELSACTTRNRLKEMFASIGILKEVQTFPQERRAVVTFAHAKDAVVCRRKFHRSFIDGTYMSVNFAI